ncbi:MAG: DUF4271 domain-containing protein [Bacteroidaceae bacterium]|nr:DUF4271 domain-containing protein [Bacteroidaceae bacterium]
MTELPCDTISLLAADTVATQEETPAPFYEDMGFFQGDSLMHPEIKMGQTGFEGILRPYQLWRDDWVTLFVVVCFVLLVLAQKKIRSYVVTQAKEFFFPSKNITRKEKVNNNSERFIPLLLMLIISIMGGLGVYMYTQSLQHLFLGQKSPYLMIGIYTGIWVAYFILKKILSSFVNWIFFDKKKIGIWKKSNFFLFSVETLLIFPIIIITIYLNLPPYIPLWITLIIALLIKILHLYKTFLIFFPKIYGTLHLIVYFCTLEIMPLLVVFMALKRVTNV